MNKEPETPCDFARQYYLGIIFQFLRYFSVFSVFTAMLIFSGCSGLDKARIVNSVQEAASVHVVGLSITPWDDYVDALQPQFPITPAAALALALPRTSISQNSVAEILSGGLQVGLPQSTQTKALTQTLTNGNQTTTQTNTTQLGSGTLPPNLLPTATLPSATAVTAPTSTVQTDPMLTYTAATAIYQEVQLLNTYINSAALRYGYVPYLATVRVDVAPLAKNEPYDVIVDIGFFSRCGPKDEASVIAIPLLVAEDVESGQRTDARNIASQLALSLGGIVSDVALQAGLSDLKNRFKAIIGTDFNSLYMVTRGADNVIQVRLGAARNPDLDVGYAMQTQTHNVSLLLLVDHKHSPDDVSCSNVIQNDDPLKAGPQIWLTSFVRIRNTLTGEDLPVDKSFINDRAKKVMARFIGEDQASSLIQVNSLGERPIDSFLTAIKTNNITTFKDAYCKIKKCQDDPPPMIEALWTGLTSIINMSEYTGTMIELPKKERPKVNEKQTVLMHDNCKDAATITFGNFGKLLPNQFTATLTLPGSISIESTNITQAVPGGPFTLQFPSLKPFGQKKDKLKKTCPDTGESVGAFLDGSVLTLKQITSDRWKNKASDLTAGPALSYIFESIYYEGVSKSDTIPKVTLSAATDTMTAETNGSGKLRLFITPDKYLTDVIISFSGAILGMPLPSKSKQVEPSEQPAASLVVDTSKVATSNSKNVVLDINLQSLVTARTVTITATGRKDGKPVAGSVSVITLPIIGPGSSKTSTSSGGGASSKSTDGGGT